MEITLLYFNDCPNWTETDRHVRRLRTEHPEVTVTRRLVNTTQDADLLNFRGSPSVLINGVDPFAPAAVGLACRLYQTPDGPAGSPT